MYTVNITVKNGPVTLVKVIGNRKFKFTVDAFKDDPILAAALASLNEYESQLEIVTGLRFHINIEEE